MKATIISTITLLFAAQASTASAAGSYFKKAWIDEHNDLRYKYQTTLNSKPLVNLTWSPELAKLAKTSALENVAQCKDSNVEVSEYGRNGYIRKGAAEGLTPTKVLEIWEKRQSYGYPQNSALTQVVWRPSKYVGCYIAVNLDKKCQAALCYYAKPGNCNMSGAEGTTPEARAKWRQKTMAENSFCTPACPPDPDGCFTSATTKSPTKRPTRRKPARELAN